MGDMSREICSWENLRLAHRRPSRGKRGREAAAAFEYHLAPLCIVRRGPTAQ